MFESPAPAQSPDLAQGIKKSPLQLNYGSTLNTTPMDYSTSTTNTSHADYEAKTTMFQCKIRWHEKAENGKMKYWIQYFDEDGKPFNGLYAVYENGLPPNVLEKYFVKQSTEK